MPSKKPRMVLYIDEIPKNKIEWLAKESNRSASNYINDILQKEIRKYELEHGEIPIDKQEE